jgi:hypothetical protein
MKLEQELEEEELEAHGNAVFLARGPLLHAELLPVAMPWVSVPILLIDGCNLPGST